MWDSLQRLIADSLEIEKDKVVPGVTFAEDLEADSMDMVEIITTIEECFAIKIPDCDAAEITTVEQARDYLEYRLKEENRLF